MGAVGLGHHDEAAGVLVEAMHDAGALDAADAGEAFAAMGDERIDQRAGPVAGGGVDDEPRRLVDDDEVGVLEHHLERNIFGRDRDVLGGRKIEHDRGAGVDAVAGIADRGAVDRDATRQDQRLVARARQLGHAVSQHAVEPFAGLLGGDHQCLAAPLRQGHEQPVGGR